MKVTRVVCCLSVLLLSLLAFAFTLSTTAHAQGPLPCTPSSNGNGSVHCTVTFKGAVTTFHVGPPPSCMISGDIPFQYEREWHESTSHL